MTNILYSILILLTAIPIGYLLHLLTQDEKNLTQYYFPALLWILAIASAIFYTTNIQYALTTTYIFITLFTWLKLTKQKPIKKTKAVKNEKAKK